MRNLRPYNEKELFQLSYRQSTEVMNFSLEKKYKSFELDCTLGFSFELLREKTIV